MDVVASGPLGLVRSGNICGNLRHWRRKQSQKKSMFLLAQALTDCCWRTESM